MNVAYMVSSGLLTPAVQHYPCSRKAETIFNILADCYPCSTLWHRMLLMPFSVTQSPCPFNFHRLKPIVLPLTYCPPYSSLCYTDCSPCLPLSHTDWSPCPLLSHRLLPMPTSLTQLLFTPMLHRLLTMPPFLPRLLPELTLFYTHCSPCTSLTGCSP